MRRVLNREIDDDIEPINTRMETRHCRGWVQMARQVEFEDFLGDDAGAVEGVVEPEVGGEGGMRGGGDDAVFAGVAGREAEDADGWEAGALTTAGLGLSLMALGRMSAVPPLGWVMWTRGISMD